MFQTLKATRLYTFLGYTSLYFQWMWALAVFIPVFLNASTSPEPSLPVVIQPSPNSTSIDVSGIPAPLIIILSVVLTLFAIVLVVFALKRGPAHTIRQLDTKTDVMATKLSPVFLPAKASARRKRTLSRRLSLSMKLSFSLLGFLCLLTSFVVDVPLERGVVFAVGFMLLPWPLVWFSLAYMFDRTSK